MFVVNLSLLVNLFKLGSPLLTPSHKPPPTLVSFNFKTVLSLVIKTSPTQGYWELLEYMYIIITITNEMLKASACARQSKLLLFSSFYHAPDMCVWFIIIMMKFIRKFCT